MDDSYGRPASLTCVVKRKLLKTYTVVGMVMYIDANLCARLCIRRAIGRYRPCHSIVVTDALHPVGCMPFYLTLTYKRHPRPVSRWLYHFQATADNHGLMTASPLSGQNGNAMLATAARATIGSAQFLELRHNTREEPLFKEPSVRKLLEPTGYKYDPKDGTIYWNRVSLTSHSPKPR